MSVCACSISCAPLTVRHIGGTQGHDPPREKDSHHHLPNLATQNGTANTRSGNPNSQRTAGPWSGPASQSCSFGCLSCSSSHSYIFTIHDCERMYCPAFTQHFLLLTALEALALVYKHFSCCMAQHLYRGLFRVYVETLSNPSWKLLGCDQRPYKSDSLINIKHSVRKKEST